jgi:hypothetical protein
MTVNLIVRNIYIVVRMYLIITDLLKTLRNLHQNKA